MKPSYPNLEGFENLQGLRKEETMIDLTRNL